MAKQQDWSIMACVFLFLSLASQIQCTRQVHFLNRMYKEIDSSVETTHFNVVRCVSVSPPQATLSGATQQNLKEKDLIKELPGQPPVNFKQYGGYVAVDKLAGRFFYYYFVESIKTKKSSPLVIWFNGGPASSSLQGAFKGHGPFRVHSDGKTLYHNPYSWNNEANILYVESPAKVGFSYTNTRSNVKIQGDKNTAEDNYMFLVKWLDRFPEYKERDLYITGQSYAGHFCSQLSQLILPKNNQTLINLRGILIGNPSLDPTVEEKGYYEYLVNHALISQESFDHYKTVCLNASTENECIDAKLNFEPLAKIIDLYNIYAPKCQNHTLTNVPKEYTTVNIFDPCSLEYMTAYLNMVNVKEAMHANTKLPYKWNKSNDKVRDSWSGNDTVTSMIPILEELMDNGVRVWVYNGDLDAMVSYTSTMDVLRNMNLTVEKVWRPWFSEGEVGGYTEEYKNKFTYATVRGAGHSVPSDQPIRALTLFTSFIHNTPLPENPLYY